MLRSVAIALTLILHLTFYIWVTIPPRHQALLESEPMHVVFVKLPASKPVPAPPPVHTRPIHVSVEHVQAPKQATHVAASSPSTAPAAPVPAMPPTQEPPEPQAIAYGNSSFEQALTQSQHGATARIPGDDEPVKVAGIHVQTPPSVAQVLSDSGHTLRCKDAIFKGRMTDEELAKRGLTERQMQMEYSELGCHP